MPSVMAEVPETSANTKVALPATSPSSTTSSSSLPSSASSTASSGYDQQASEQEEDLLHTQMSQVEVANDSTAPLEGAMTAEPEMSAEVQQNNQQSECDVVDLIGDGITFHPSGLLEHQDAEATVMNLEVRPNGELHLVPSPSTSPASSEQQGEDFIMQEIHIELGNDATAHQHFEPAERRDGSEQEGGVVMQGMQQIGLGDVGATPQSCGLAERQVGSVSKQKEKAARSKTNVAVKEKAKMLERERRRKQRNLFVQLNRTINSLMPEELLTQMESHRKRRQAGYSRGNTQEMLREKHRILEKNRRCSLKSLYGSLSKELELCQGGRRSQATVLERAMEAARREAAKEKALLEEKAKAKRYQEELKQRLQLLRTEVATSGEEMAPTKTMMTDDIDVHLQKIVDNIGWEGVHDSYLHLLP